MSAICPERRVPVVQVAVLGAAGGIGQPLSLLMKMNPLVSKLAIYDIANTPGVGADLSHINTPAQARTVCPGCNTVARGTTTDQSPNFPESSAFALRTRYLCSERCKARSARRSAPWLSGGTEPFCAPTASRSRPSPVLTSSPRPSRALSSCAPSQPPAVPA